MVLLTALRPGAVPYAAGRRNPIGVEAVSPWLPPAELALAVLALIGLVRLVRRYRRAVGDERQQLGWFLYAVAVLAVVTIHNGSAPEALNEPLWLLFVAAVTFVPVAIGIAVLRHNLFDIDVVVHRTIAYGVLSALAIGLYAVLVGGAAAVFQRSVGLGSAVLATVVVALVITPARQALQRWADRVVYGQRRDPAAVVAALGWRLRSSVPAEELPTVVVSTLAEALRLRYVALELQQPDGAVVVATSGEPRSDVAPFPLEHQGEQVGRLLVGPPGDLTEQDRRVLTGLAGQAGAALQAAKSSLALCSSRESDWCCLARRSGACCTGTCTTASAPTSPGSCWPSRPQETSCADPDAAAAILARVRQRAAAAIEGVRSVVEGLRPPALEESGLVAALRAQATLLSGSGVQCRVEVTGPADDLPAAVEVAAYRIAVEAMTNAVRHAGATEVVVRLDADVTGTGVEVTDDGGGMPKDPRRGVGIASMRERAAELGGTFAVDSSPTGGTTITTVLSALRAGATGYVVKGAGQDELRRALAATAAGEVLLGPDVARRALALALDPPADQPLPQLTSRERDVLELLASGRRDAEVATALGVAPKTVRNNVANILVKLAVGDRGQAVALARDAGLGTRRPDQPPVVPGRPGPAPMTAGRRTR